jgi:hypothetical protein
MGILFLPALHRGLQKNRENPSITLLPAGLRLGSVFSGALIADSLIGQEDSL